GHTLRVMNADGTGDRVLLDGQAVDCHYPTVIIRPAWSPDGTHIAFSCHELEHGIRVVGADGSDLRTVIPNGRNPYWSPDGSRIAFQLSGRLAMLAIVNADGTNVQTFGHGAHGGPWNPLLSAVPGEPNSTATTGENSPFFYAIVAVGVVGVFVLVWRLRRRSPPGDSTPSSI
ncbi:MAG: TolB family protein, partial [bacterium]